MTATALTIRIALLGAIALLTTATVAWAGGDNGHGAPKRISGTYKLRGANGAAPPVTLTDIVGRDGSLKVELLNGVVTLRDDMTFAMTLATRSTEDGVVVFEGPETSPGTYTRSGNTLTFYHEDDTFTATYANGSLAFVEVGSTPLRLRFSR